MRRTLLLLALLCSWHALLSQPRSPFGGTHDDSDITAYWYNVPKDSLRIVVMGQTLQFHSTLEIYGQAPSDSFAVSASVSMPDGSWGTSREYVVQKGKKDPSYQVQWRGKFFKLITSASYKPVPPAKILVAVQSGLNRRTKEIACRYHRLSGKIADFEGKPFRAVVLVRPDDFDGTAGVWSDAAGNYSILLPERIYGNIFVDDESYGLKTAEAWGWHIIADADQTLDFKVGTGEVYNLIVWPNNGGARTYFLSFRPMSVFFYQNQPPQTSVTIEEKSYDVLDVAPRLKSNEITVRFNGKEAPIVSLQKYYEWTSGRVMPAYLLQVSRENLENIGKQSVIVEYQSESELGGKKVVHTSTGVFQFYPNFSGLSFY